MIRNTAAVLDGKAYLVAVFDGKAYLIAVLDRIAYLVAVNLLCYQTLNVKFLFTLVLEKVFQ